MILRRVISHLRNQEWTAVGLDFLIVIVGVFVALQAQQWALEQQRAANESIYLNSLHTEVVNLIEERGLYDRIRDQNASWLLEVVSILEGEVENEILSPDQCLAIVDMRYATTPPTGLPTAQELLSAGEINVIRSPRIRSAMLDFQQNADRARDLIAEISRTSLNIPHLYPEYFRVTVVADSGRVDGYWREAECDVTSMRLNRRFMNDLNEASFVYQIYNDRGVQRVSLSLQAFHQTLDAVLSLDHSQEEAHL